MSKVKIKNSKKVFNKTCIILIFDLGNHEIVKNRVRFREKFPLPGLCFDFLILTFDF